MKLEVRNYKFQLRASSFKVKVPNARTESPRQNSGQLVPEHPSASETQSALQKSAPRSPERPRSRVAPVQISKCPNVRLAAGRFVKAIARNGGWLKNKSFSSVAFMSGGRWKSSGEKAERGASRRSVKRATRKDEGERTSTLGGETETGPLS